MMDPRVATYGEENRLWTGDEARAFARVAAIPALLAARAGRGRLMVTTTRVRLDRIASSTRNAHLTTEVIVGHEIVAAEGYVLAVRLLTDKSTYNTVEDLAGRMVSLREGDVLAGTLGSRRALRGYAGEVPSHIAVGDTIEVLNLGGILGRCTSANPDIGPPFKAEVLGAVLAFPELGDRIGRPAHIRDGAIPSGESLDIRRAGGLRGRHLHERRQDGGRHGAGAGALPERAPRGRRQADRRLADARHALDAGRRRRRGADLQRRRRREHPCGHDGAGGEGPLQPPASARSAPT